MMSAQYVVAAVLMTVGMLSQVKAAPAEDLVTSLPDLEGPQPTFNHYAGYLTASPGRHFFYWFVESENDPSQDPVVLWLNGGPGCSSLTGLLAELGPWRTKPDGSGLVWFEDRWNKIANIIFLESPQCVGYSYADDGICATGDNRVASDNHLALKDFFVKFPEYKNNDFYITGESYAGIYVPTLASLIEDDPEFNFLGFAVGNSVTDNAVMGNGYPYFAWARGLFGTDLWNDLLDHCCVDRNASNCVFYESGNPQCAVLNGRVIAVQWSIGLNPYNLYAECYGGAPDRRGVVRETDSSVQLVVPELFLRAGKQRRQEFVELIEEFAETKNVSLIIPCSDTSDREIYLNRADVREALHVNPAVETWLPCGNFAYDYEYDDVRAEYYKVLNKGHRIVAYYGDLDMACDHLSGMWFTESLNVTVNDPFKEWFYPDSMGYNQIAGFVIQFDGMKFVSFKGAGHFVPADAPLASYMMFEKFLHDEPY